MCAVLRARSGVWHIVRTLATLQRESACSRMSCRRVDAARGAACAPQGICRRVCAADLTHKVEKWSAQPIFCCQS
eukprot:4986069-Alexandrium_andersonii.AAC.1